jgi:transcriptional regulator
MYVPTTFTETDLAVLHDFLDAHSFAILCSQHDGVPCASHLPLLLQRDPAPGVLVGHMARANPQWQQAPGQEVLAVFSGPHTYVSPAWYEAENVVPTWNFVAVHATGVFELIEEHDELVQLLRTMVDLFEGSRPEPWQMSGDPAYLDRQLRGLVGFRVRITRLEGKWKLSQNYPEERQRKVIAGLRREGGAKAQEIARLMEERLPR